jgi:hypothetical protein
MLFEPTGRFEGLPLDGFEVFAIPNRGERRRAIITTFHPALERLGSDLVRSLSGRAEKPLHAHLPRLDWPRSYQPFCTWVALSHDTHGYQNRAQLNLGVHADYVAIRLGWDTTQASFGRFEFICRHDHLGEELAKTAREEKLAYRVYGSAPWPQGSRLVFESPDDWQKAFEVTHHRGVWFELGVRHDLPGAGELISGPGLGDEARRVFGALLPFYEKL